MQYIDAHKTGLGDARHTPQPGDPRPSAPFCGLSFRFSLKKHVKKLLRHFPFKSSSEKAPSPPRPLEEDWVVLGSPNAKPRVFTEPLHCTGFEVQSPEATELLSMNKVESASKRQTGVGRGVLGGHGAVEGPCRRRRPQRSVFVESELSFTIPRETIGSGAFGSVLKAKYRGEDVAAKVIDSIHATPSMRKALRNELDLLSHMPPHENVVTLLGGCMEPYCCIVEELCDTDLDHVIHPNGAGMFEGPPPKPMPIEQVLQVGLDVTKGLAHLHPKVIHRDVKPKNILMKNGIAKVADFGLSALKEKSYMSGAGTAGYMSPESLKNRVNHKSDVYSLGILLWECITGLTPFQNYNNKYAVMYAVDNGVRPDFPASSDCPQALRALIKSCWRQDHRSRPECAEITDTLEEIKMCLFGN